MSFVAVAIGGSALIGAGATMIASNQSSKAIEGATNASIAEQNSILQQQAALNAPYRNIGTGGNGNQGAIQQYQNLLGLGPSGAAGVQPALAATPGYQFALGQGTTNTVNAASAMGLGLSGNTLQGIDQFSTGLADQTYQAAVGNARDAVGIGQAAAAGQAANLGAAGSTISSNLLAQGNAIAGIDANEAASLSKLATGAVGQYTDYNILKNLSTPA